LEIEAPRKGALRREIGTGGGEPDYQQQGRVLRVAGASAEGPMRFGWRAPVAGKAGCPGAVCRVLAAAAEPPGASAGTGQYSPARTDRDVDLWHRKIFVIVVAPLGVEHEDGLGPVSIPQLLPPVGRHSCPPPARSLALQLLGRLTGFRGFGHEREGGLFGGLVGDGGGLEPQTVALGALGVADERV
jgi:hypothetical protein